MGKFLKGLGYTLSAASMIAGMSLTLWFDKSPFWLLLFLAGLYAGFELAFYDKETGILLWDYIKTMSEQKNQA